MNVFLMSLRCGHCVLIKACWTYEQITECSEKATRSPCPVCNVRVRYEDIVATVLENEASAFQSMPWKDAVNVPQEAFSEFQSDDVEVPSFSTGKVADALRAKFQKEAGDTRRKQYEAVSEAFGPYIAGQRAAMAASEGDHATAIPLYEQALTVADEPAHRAALQASLAFCLVTTEKVDRVASLLRDYMTYTGEQPPVQRSMATATAFQLGFLLCERGDLGGGQSAYRLAMELGDPEWAASAALNLGVLVEQEGRIEDAVPLVDYAYQHGEDETRLMAAYNIGWYSEVQGDRRKAQKFYKIALASRDSDVLGRAQSGLRRLS